jgi:MoxR-like ATPase
MTVQPRTAAEFATVAQRVADNVGHVIKGKPEVIRLALVALLAEGHLLVEDVPGVGKTSLARALAASLDLAWQRVQFTPDLLPSDVTGAAVYHQNTQTFEFHPGPVFANIVVADEINRASPKTQSALLEVMEERVVTVDGHPHEVPRPFVVMATQNPIEMDGTYRLPEAQLDRFLLRIPVGYPSHDAEVEILTSGGSARTVSDLRPVATVADLTAAIEHTRQVHASAPLTDYVVRLVAATREHADVRLGGSPRASLALLRAAQASAVLAGRDFVTADDVKALTRYVLGHRVLLNPAATVAGRSVDDVLSQSVAATPVPTSLES